MLRITHILRDSWRAVAAVLLLVIGIHAAAPVGQPLQRQAGSAFSAATADVSLGQARRVNVAKRQEQWHAPPSTAKAQRVALAEHYAAVVPITAYDAHAPPFARASFSPLAPRAPPAA